MPYDGSLKQIKIYVGSKYKFDPFLENSNVNLQVLGTDMMRPQQSK